MTLDLPAGVDWSVHWPLHKIATSGHYHDSLHTIETQWSVSDAWIALDVIEALEAAQNG